MTKEMILYYTMLILFTVQIVLFVAMMVMVFRHLLDKIHEWKFEKEMHELRRKEHEEYMRKKEKNS